MSSSSRAIDEANQTPVPSGSDTRRNRWNPFGEHQTTEPTPYHLPPQSAVSPTTPASEKALARAIMQQARSAGVDHREAPPSPMTSGQDAEGFSSRSAEHLMDYDSNGRAITSRYAKGQSFRRHSKATRYRWGLFFSHLILCFVILGLSIQIHKRVVTEPRSDMDVFLSSNTFLRVKFWKSFPFISLGIGGVAIAALWVLDAYYPITLLSRPRGQVFYLMGVMTFQGGFTVGWCFVTPFVIEATSQTTRFWDWPRVFILSWTIAGCMLAQIFILTAVCFIIIFSTSRHIRAGRRDALYHPLCRYDPSAPRAIDMLSKSQVTPSFIGGSTSLIGTTTFGSSGVGMQKLRSVNGPDRTTRETSAPTSGASHSEPRRDTIPIVPSPLSSHPPIHLPIDNNNQNS